MVSILISIHAPLSRCDQPANLKSLIRSYFNPRTSFEVRPEGSVFPLMRCNFNPRTSFEVRQLSSSSPVLSKVISIHAPLSRCDAKKVKEQEHGKISIHAPQSGCDYMIKMCFWGQTAFQSTHPNRGATDKGSKFSNLVRTFQSTHPNRGATLTASLISWNLIFQSTHPNRGATRNPQRTPETIKISIHAPQSGCDPGMRAKMVAAMKFQSTHPNRGATDDAVASPKAFRFQSTHPNRGATKCYKNKNSWWKYFNPRTPIGVRRKSYG